MLTGETVRPLSHDIPKYGTELFQYINNQAPTFVTLVQHLCYTSGRFAFLLKNTVFHFCNTSVTLLNNVSGAPIL